MTPQTRGSDSELRDYLRVIWRRKAVIAVSVMVVVGASLISSFLQTPIYAATAEILIEPRVVESPFDPNSGLRSSANSVENEKRVLTGKAVQDAVQKEIGGAPGISTGTVSGTDVISVTAESTVPQQAATIANAYSKAYIDFRRKQAVDDLLAASKEIQAKITDLQKQIDAAPPAQKENLVDQQALFKQKLDQFQVDVALKSGGATLITPAVAPVEPVRPTPIRSGILAGALGLMMGVAVAYLIEYLDDSVKTKDDVDRVTPGLPVLGLIPIVPGWKSREEPQVASVDEPKSAAAEAYRTLRTALQFLALEQPLRTLQVTSPGAQEGKTTTLVNLGVALARSGRRVVIVCCDLRRPRVHDFFGLDNSVGFTSVLLGKVPLTSALQPVPDQPRLSVLASGPLPPNPSELLSSRRTVEVLTSLQAEADIVLVDSPPILPVTDGLILSGRVDATLVVSVAGATTRKELARTVELLNQVDAPLIGTVLNGVTESGAYGYAYQYYRYEQSDNGRPPAVPWRDRQPAKKR